MSAAIFRWVDVYLRATGFKIVQAPTQDAIEVVRPLDLHSNLILPRTSQAYASGRDRIPPFPPRPGIESEQEFVPPSIATSELLELQETGLDPSLIHLQALMCVLSINNEACECFSINGPTETRSISAPQKLSEFS